MEEKLPEREIKPRGSVAGKLENFWYHYKWHTLIVLFILLVVTVCTLQMCKKESYDVYALYAGPTDVSKISDGGIPPYSAMLSALKKMAADRDGDGAASPAFDTLFVMTNAEIDAYREAHKDDGTEPNVTKIKENLSVLEADILYGDYYVCFLSESLYNIYKTRDGVDLFVPLADYVGDADVEYVDACAVRLSSTAFGSSPGFADLPADTVICLRALTEVKNSGLGAKRNRALFIAAEETVKNIFAMG